jgi:hypothetical protein
MADMKIPGERQLPVARPANPARTEAVRAAQRAFFDAALTAAPAAARPAPQAAQAQEASPRAASPAQDATQRYLRPGSRVDIKV